MPNPPDDDFRSIVLEVPLLGAAFGAFAHNLLILLEINRYGTMVYREAVRPILYTEIILTVFFMFLCSFMIYKKLCLSNDKRLVGAEGPRVRVTPNPGQRVDGS